MNSCLETLSTNIRTCRICRDAPHGLPLPHDPRPVVRLSSSARVAICGQAPGKRVHDTGLPFNDPSGDRLRSWMNVDRETFYDQTRLAIVPMGFCFPGYNDKKADLPPRKECRITWHDQVFAAMPQLELILVIGQYAMAYHLGALRKPTLTETVADWRGYFHQDTSPRVFPLPHPSWRNNAWIKKNPWFSDELLPELQREIARLI